MLAQHILVTKVRYWTKTMGSILWKSLLLPLFAHAYVPGTPRVYHWGDTLRIYSRPIYPVNPTIGVPVSFDKLPFCPIAERNNTGAHEDTRADLFVSDPSTPVLDIIFGENLECYSRCNITINEDQRRMLERYIDEERTFTWLVDDLPSLQYHRLSPVTNTNILTTGTPIGEVLEDGHRVLNNAFHLEIDITPAAAPLRPIYNLLQGDATDAAGKRPFTIQGFRIRTSSWAPMAEAPDQLICMGQQGRFWHPKSLVDLSLRPSSA